MAWKAISVSLVIAIVIVIGLAWWIWPRGGGETTVTEENVRFDFQMMFTYYSSEENVALENLDLFWSAPKVDNTLPKSIEAGAWWKLYYIEDDNMLTLQADYFGVENLRGSRTSELEVSQFGNSGSEYGPVYGATLDMLYSREIFVLVGYEIDSRETADKLTLKVYEQTGSIAQWNPIGQENQRIDYSFWVGLRRENVLVEQFEWVQENYGPSWVWLWPV